MTAEAITITEKTIGIWRVELPGGNWLAHLFHNDGTTPNAERPLWTTFGNSRAKCGASLLRHIQLAYRFRWYDNARAERHWAIWAMRPGTSDAEALEAAREAQDRLMSYGLGGWEMLRSGRSPAEFFSAVREMPGMSTSTTEPEVTHAA